MLKKTMQSVSSPLVIGFVLGMGIIYGSVLVSKPIDHALGSVMYDLYDYLYQQKQMAWFVEYFPEGGVRDTIQVILFFLPSFLLGAVLYKCKFKDMALGLWMSASIFFVLVVMVRFFVD